jgi:transcriptional regulator with XRE-family HTH domain
MSSKYYNEQIKTLIKTARIGLNIKQSEAAELCSISLPHFCNLENGRTWPTDEICDLLSEKLGIDRSSIYLAANKLPPEVQERVIKLYQLKGELIFD